VISRGCRTVEKNSESSKQRWHGVEVLFFRVFTVLGGLIAAGASELADVLPGWVGAVGGFVSGVAINAERIFGRKKPSEAERLRR